MTLQVVSDLRPLRSPRNKAADSVYLAQPTYSSNDINNDDKCEVFAQPGLAMAKKKQFK